ncbi:MAG: acetyl-CoA carboxylase biotin carboxyl carrier protein [Chakrabartia sp.]
MTEKTNGTMHVDVKLVRQLAELLDETKLSEIEVEDGGRRIRVARNMTSVAVAAPVAAAPAAIAAPVAAVAAPVGDHPGTVKSPMVGTVYLSASPEAFPFVSVGATVAEGDTLVIIEAMKVMNPILAPRGGKVTQIIVSNNQPVEFDQPLVVIE